MSGTLLVTRHICHSRAQHTLLCAAVERHSSCGIHLRPTACIQGTRQLAALQGQQSEPSPPVRLASQPASPPVRHRHPPVQSAQQGAGQPHRTCGPRTVSPSTLRPTTAQCATQSESARPTACSAPTAHNRIDRLARAGELPSPASGQLGLGTERTDSAACRAWCTALQGWRPARSYGWISIWS